MLPSFALLSCLVLAPKVASGEIDASGHKAFVDAGLILSLTMSAVGQPEPLLPGAVTEGKEPSINAFESLAIAAAALEDGKKNLNSYALLAPDPDLDGKRGPALVVILWWKGEPGRYSVVQRYKVQNHVAHLIGPLEIRLGKTAVKRPDLLALVKQGIRKYPTGAAFWK